MKNKIEIISHKVDWMKVIKLAFSKKDWGKTFILYKEKKININCTMESFSFVEDSALFLLKCNYEEDKHFNQWNNEKNIVYHMKNSTIEEFKKRLLKEIIKLLEQIELSRFRSKGKIYHKKLLYVSSDITPDIIKKYNFTELYGSIELIEDEDIKENLRFDLNYRILNLLNLTYNRAVEKYIITNSSKKTRFSNLINKVTKDFNKK